MNNLYIYIENYERNEQDSTYEKHATTEVVEENEHVAELMNENHEQDQLEEKDYVVAKARKEEKQDVVDE